MLNIINQIKVCTDLEKLKKLFKKFCQECGEAPDDAGLMDMEIGDEEIRNWIHDKHPEMVESFEKEISSGEFGGAYFYALCPDSEDGEEWEDAMIHILALYYIENPEAFSAFIEYLEQEWAE